MKDTKYKYLKRFLALVLSAAIIITYMPTSLMAYASDETNAPAATEQAAEETKAEETTAPEAKETTAPETADTQDTASAADEETTPESSVSEEAAPEAEAEAEKPDEPLDDPEVEEATPEEKAQMPAHEFTGSAGGVSVTVAAPEGALPEGTEMVVEAVSSDDVIDAISEAVEGEVKQIKAVDITFFKDGTEIQPQKEVAVTLSTARMKSADNYSVVHVADNGVAQEVTDADASRNGAEFSAESFSVYAVIGTNDGIDTDEKARRTYKFVLDDGTPYYFTNTADKKVDYQIVKNGDTVVEPKPAPTKNNSDSEAGAWKFDGWYNGDTKFDFGSAESGITEDETVTLKAKFSHVYYVHYYDTEYDIEGTKVQNIMESKEVAEGETAEVDSIQAVPLSTNEKFAGWSTSKDAETVEYKAGDSLGEMTSDINLYPVLEKAYWIHFHSNGDKATYTAPAQFFATEDTTEPAVPTRVGYTFKEWCTDEAGETPFTWGGKLTADVDLYASWTPSDTQYTVITWQENADDDEYSFLKSEKKTGKSGEKTNVAAESFTGFHVYGKDADETDDAYKLTQQTIAGDGSTIVNVYYNRNDYEVKFYKIKTSRDRWGRETYSAGDLIDELTITAKYNQTITDKWPSRRTGLSRTYPVNWKVSPDGSTFQANLPQMPVNGAKFYLVEESTGYVMTNNYYVQTTDGGNNFSLDHADVFNSDNNGWSTTVEDYYDIKGFTVNFRNSSDAGGHSNYKTDTSVNTSAAVGSDYDHVGGWQSNRYKLDFYYLRNKYTVNFDLNGATGTAPKAAEVYYEKSLAGIAPAAYVVDETQYTDAQGKVYLFKGWYENNTGAGDAFDFSGTTMPANNINLYAKWEEQNFKVNVDPNGGVLTKTESTWFNVKWGEEIQPYDDVRRDYVESADGTFYYHIDKRPSSDFGRKSLYTEDSSASSDGKKYIYEKDAYQLIGWYDAATDKPYNFGSGVTKDTNIVAKWKRVGKFTVTIFYNDAEGKPQTVEGLSYSDQATAVAPTSVPFTPEGQTLVGWRIKKTNEILDLGESFTVDASTMSEKVEGNEIIEIDPIFKDNDKLDVTNITFNANGGTGTVPDASNLDLNGNESETNNKVTLPSDGFTKDGYELIGWSTQSGNNTVEYILGGNYAADGKDNTLYAVWAEKINVTVTGLEATEKYDGSEKSNATATAPKGYTVTAAGKDTTDASDLVDITVADTVKAPATGTNAGEYPMGLSDDTVTAALKGETKNIKNAGTVVVKNNKYYILGDKTVTDGKLTITPNTDEVTVTILENSGTAKYDGTDKTVTGYTVKSISNTKYTEADFTFSGNATVTGKDAGTYNMELKPGDFTNKNANFSNVKFVIEDGTLEISKRSVTLTSASDDKVYDGQPLTNSTVTVTGDGFVTGEGATYKVTGTQTEVGNSKNTFSYNLNNGTKAANYDIKTVEGTLTVTQLTDKVTVTITENSGTEKYDGKEKTVKGYTVKISNPLYTEKDFTFSGNDSVKGTDAGSYPMQLKASDFTNTNKNFKEVEFVIVDGTLEISKRTVTLTSADDDKVYDGKALTNDKVTVGGDGFASGEGATYDVTGTQTDVGSSANSFTYKLNEGTKAANYDISKTEGTLEVTPVKDKVTVTIKEHSGSFKYDGTEKAATGYDVSIDNELYTTDDFTFNGKAEVKGTDAGTYPMELKKSDFTNTSKNFTNVEFVIVDGELKISKREVTLTSADGEKVYDGTALTKNEQTDVKVSGDGFAEGEGAVYDITGTQTEVGSSANSFTYTLNDGTKADNYTIKTVEGTLTVTEFKDEVTVTITENSGKEKYDGSEKSVTGYTVEISNPLYTENDFTFSGKDEVKGTDAGTYNMELKPEDFKNTSKNFSKVTFKIVDGTLEISKRTVTLTSADDDKVYDGTALTNDKVTVGGEGFAKGEGAAYKVTGTRTEVGETPNSFTYKLNEGTKAANYEITKTEGTLTVTPVTDKVTVTITENSGSEKYDGAEKTVTGYEVTDISNKLYKESDFTFKGNDTVKGTDAGSYPMELKPADFTNISKNFSEVEFVIVDGTLEIAKREVTLTSADDTKVYDGKALTNDKVTVSGDGWAKGEGATYDVTGTRTEVGDTPNAFTYKLNDGTKAANYKITKTEGTLTVTPVTDKVTVTITENSGTEKYDGTEKTVTGYKVTSISNPLYTEKDFTFGGDATVKGTDAGIYQMNLKPADFTNNSKNFTNVEFVIVDGTLEITKRTVTLTSATDDKVYDGTALTNDKVTVGGDGWADGEGAAYDVTGTQTNAGESKNTFTYTLNEGTNADNYTVTTTEGTLTVTPVTDKVTVTITGHNDEVDYNGSEQKVEGYDVSIDNELYTEEDFSYSGDATAKATDVKRNGKEVEAYPMGLKESDFKNISKNFTNVKFEVTDGSLKIKPLAVTIESASAEKAYDGTPLTKHDDMVIDGFVDGEGLASINVTGSQTYVGSSDNTFTYKLFTPTRRLFAKLIGVDADEPATYKATKATKADNYDITVNYGTLTVTDEGVDIDDVTTKTHEDKEYKLGETVTFTIEVTNIYDKVKTITVTEQEGVKITSDSVFKDVKPGEKVTATAEYVVTEEDILAGSFNNTATVKFSDVDKPYEPEDEVDVEDPKGHVTITKVATSKPADGKAYKTGEKVTYKITVTNDGNISVKDVEVRDDLTGDVWNVDSIAPGKSEVFNAVYTVTKEDAKKGSVSNIATATGTTDDPDNPNPTIVPGKTTVTTDVPEEPATGGKGVKTGDDNNIPGAIGGFFASLAALFGAVYVRRRKNSEE